MAPCFDRIGTSLLCAEDVHVGEWEDNAGSCNGDLWGCKPRGKAISHMLAIEDDEFISFLMEKEEASVNKINNYVDSYQGKDEELQMRAQAIDWMLDVRRYYGFGSPTAFLSVIYFDRFLSKHANSRKKTWLLQLVAVGSISLAAKLQETEVPLLCDLQVGDVEHVFESRTIQRMELLIMSTLDWEMTYVTPFSYLHYLLKKADFLGGLSEALFLRSEELILRSCRDLRFLVYSPSVVAVASLVSACKELPSQDARLQRALHSIWPSKEMEAMEWACLMDEMLRGGDPSWTSPSSRMGWRKASAPQSPLGVLDVTCFSSESCDRTLNTSHTTNMCASTSACMRPSIQANNILQSRSLARLNASNTNNVLLSTSLMAPSNRSNACNELAASSSPTSASLPPQLPSKRKKLSLNSPHILK